MFWSLVGVRIIFTPARKVFLWVFHPWTPDTCANIPPGVEAWVGDFEAQVIADKGVALQFALSNHWDTTEVTLHHLLITTSPMAHTTSTYCEYCSLSLSLSTAHWVGLNHLVVAWKQKHCNQFDFHGIHYWNPLKSMLVYHRVVHALEESIVASDEKLPIANICNVTCLKINCLNIWHE